MRNVATPVLRDAQESTTRLADHHLLIICHFLKNIFICFFPFLSTLHNHSDVVQTISITWLELEHFWKALESIVLTRHNTIAFEVGVNKQRLTHQRHFRTIPVNHADEVFLLNTKKTTRSQNKKLLTITRVLFHCFSWKYYQNVCWHVILQNKLNVTITSEVLTPTFLTYSL